VPRLAGQAPGYLVLRLAELTRSGVHPSLPAAKDTLDAPALAALAAYFGKLLP
jgi:cytochrome c553